MEENSAEYSSRILESGQLLDIRAERIRKLEKYVCSSMRQETIRGEKVTRFQ